MSTELRNWYQQPSVVFDFDGTLCSDNYPGIGDPIREMVDAVLLAKGLGYWVVVATSRPHGYYPDVQRWLKDHGILFDQLVTSGKVNADITFDDKGLLPPPNVIEALLTWRLSGFGVQALATPMKSAYSAHQRNVPESPSYDPALGKERASRFRVVVPVSGGLDSSTAYALAVERYGTDAVWPIYVRVGDDGGLARLEIRAFCELFEEDPSMFIVHVDADRDQHIVHGRNAIILFSVAREMTRKGWWGEIWFGNLGGETPIVGGDKSSSFLATTQHLMTVLGQDVRIVSPFQALDKVDLVKIWLDWGRRDAFEKMKTCFSPTEHRCAKCQTCFRMWAALMGSGAEGRGIAGKLFPRLEGLVPYAKKYEAAIYGDNEYGPRRLRGMKEAITAMKRWGYFDQ